MGEKKRLTIEEQVQEHMSIKTIKEMSMDERIMMYGKMTDSINRIIEIVRSANKRKGLPDV